MNLWMSFARVHAIYIEQIPIRSEKAMIGGWGHSSSFQKVNMRTTHCLILTRYSTQNR